MRNFKRILAALWLTAALSFGALPNNTTWEVRNGGVDSNGGGFLTGASGTDYSQQAAAHCTATDFTLPTTTTATSATCPFGSDSVGNIIQVTAGTNCTAGWYQVVSVASVTATLDRAAGTTGCTAGTFAIGGALKTLSKLNSAMNTTSPITQTAWVKADSTYSVSGNLSWSFATNTGVTYTTIQGYTSSRGDTGQPTIQASAGSFTMFTMGNNNNAFWSFENFILDCNSQTNCKGLDIENGQVRAVNIAVMNAFGGFIGGDFADPYFCERCSVLTLKGTNSVGIDFSAKNHGQTCIQCVVYGDGASTGQVGFKLQGGSCILCIAAHMSAGTTGDGFDITSSAAILYLDRIAVDDVSRDAIRITNSSSNPRPIVIENSVFVGGANGYCVNFTANVVPAGAIRLDYNGCKQGGSGDYHNATAGTASVGLSVDPFTNSAINVNDFSLNSTALGGAALKALGYPGILNGGGGYGGTGFIDIGPLQTNAALSASTRQVCSGCFFH